MHGCACKQYVFRSYGTSTFSAVHFNENPFTCRREKEDKNVLKFEISHFYWLFLSDVLAVKGLMAAGRGLSDEFLKLYQA